MEVGAGVQSSGAELSGSLSRWHGWGSSFWIGLWTVVCLPYYQEEKVVVGRLPSDGTQDVRHRLALLSSFILSHVHYITDWHVISQIASG